ncbi:hypothetical protein CI102_14413 [Trichoderma harzianum]|uniref:Uncharacterized protein n=1 Tax=Trichoderma harzianum CBS 226.95 TaxID=983964 RepID=A0A2T3ZZ91_TRIHA|nr:hypothetical protein M431DRAFT_261414 [Trichoderma harzianum CBS 226.95]PKK41157.1 hypothetical protein CI102_14413 [Trichoderma harzianum]PTB50134.1 hypothetical protein M431DRAFT_261414 [Trichoderma harzianum CBS 226.95]
MQGLSFFFCSRSKIWRVRDHCAGLKLDNDNFRLGGFVLLTHTPFGPHDPDLGITIPVVLATDQISAGILIVLVVLTRF